MPSASILTKTSDQVVSSAGATAGNTSFTWQTETKYLDANLDFFDAGTDDTLLSIPGSLDGTPYEVFGWWEDTSEGTFTSGMYSAYRVLSTTGGDPYRWIFRNTVRPAFGFRTGPKVADSDGIDYYVQMREFTSETITARSSRCRLAIIMGEPLLRAFAGGSTSGFSASTTETDANIAEAFDIGDVYDPTTGIYTAPAGASLAAVNCNGWRASVVSDSCRYRLYKEGSEVAQYHFGGGLRNPGPGTFGLIDIAPGEELKISIQMDGGSANTMDLNHSVEFF